MGTLFRSAFVDDLLEINIRFVSIVGAGTDELLEFTFHNVAEQKIALPVSEAHHVSVHVVDVQAAFVVRIAVYDVQRPIAETRIWVRLPADPFRAVEIAVFTRVAPGRAVHQLGGRSRRVYAREPSWFGGRARPLLAVAAAAHTSSVSTVVLEGTRAHLPPAALAPAGLSAVVVSGLVISGSRRGPATPNMFLMNLSVDVIVVAFDFVMVDRGDSYGFVIVWAVLYGGSLVGAVGVPVVGMLFLYCCCWFEFCYCCFAHWKVVGAWDCWGWLFFP